MISVLDVGDGACTVLRARFGQGIAVVDCGSNDLGADEACERLLGALGHRPEAITSIIITHFDTDHYAGFLRLAERMEMRGQRFPRLTLIAPRPPDTEPEYVARYLAMAMLKTGIRNLDLVEALRRVTVDGRFCYVPVSRDRWSMFSAVDFEFSVHWPPVALPAGVARQVRTALCQYESLAARLKERGDSTLDDNFEIARQGLWPAPPYDAARSSESPEEPDCRDDSFELESFDGDDEDSFAPDVRRLNLPPDLEETFRGAWDAFRRANNNMSIIFDDAEKHELVVFGDAGRAVLSSVMNRNELAVRYRAMLAPHHGTHRLPANFDVTAELCVSQNGARRGHLWDRHLASHAGSTSCVSTRAGNHHLYDSACGPCRCPWCS